MAPKALTAAADSGTLVVVQVDEAARSSHRTAALPVACVTAGERAGTETRVRGFDHAGEGCIWGSSLPSPESHWGNGHVYVETAVDRQKVTNLRLPGQYDERLLGSLGLQGPYYNWNRWYLPGMGRYLELDPEGFKGHLRPRGETGGEGPQWYSYAGGNPLRYVDPEGLYTKDDKCRNLPTEADLREAANSLSDEEGPWGCSLRQCVLKQVDAAHISCNTVEEYCRNPTNVGHSGGGSCEKPGREVDWCSRKKSRQCMIDAMIHEFAHSCGWNHWDSGGVPGISGVIASCNG